MRKVGLAIALALSVTASGCVQSRQYADVQFTPPKGDYRLLVMRPDVTVTRRVVFGSTPDNPTQHLIGYADEVDPDALFAAGKAWGIKVVNAVE